MLLLAAFDISSILVESTSLHFALLLFPPWLLSTHRVEALPVPKSTKRGLFSPGLPLPVDPLLHIISLAPHRSFDYTQIPPAAHLSRSRFHDDHHHGTPFVQSARLLSNGNLPFVLPLRPSVVCNATGTVQASNRPQSPRVCACTPSPVWAALCSSTGQTILICVPSQPAPLPIAAT